MTKEQRSFCVKADAGQDDGYPEASIQARELLALEKRGGECVRDTGSYCYTMFRIFDTYRSGGR